MEEREKKVWLTEAGQIPVTAIPVFSSLLKSMACRELEVSSLSEKTKVAWRSDFEIAVENCRNTPLPNSYLPAP